MFIFLILLYSCSIIPKIKDSDIDPITNKFWGVYSNKPHSIRANHELTKYDSSTTLLQLFNNSKNKNPEIDSIQIIFDSHGQLQLSTKDSCTPLQIMKGSFSKKGYYEIYFSNKKIEIPPIIHFFFSNHNVERLRLYKTKDNDLIVYRYYYYSGNFLLVGGEGPKKKQFFFRKL